MVPPLAKVLLTIILLVHVPFEDCYASHGKDHAAFLNFRCKGFFVYYASHSRQRKASLLALNKYCILKHNLYRQIQYQCLSFSRSTRGRKAVKNSIYQDNILVRNKYTPNTHIIIYENHYVWECHCYSIIMHVVKF